MGTSTRLLTTLVGMFLLILGLAPVAGAAELPNIVLIISDDQAWTDYGFMGHPAIETPHLDRLARESALFRRGYVPTSLCRPSLATMITGLYPHQHGITGNDPALLPGQRRRGGSPEYQALRNQLIAKIDQSPTLPRLLAQKGYLSLQTGKWWEGHYSRGGFTHGMTHGDPRRGGRHGDEGLKIGRQGMQPIYDFIDSVGEKPFFIWYAPFLPHTPHNPPERLLQKYTAPDRPKALAEYYAMCEWFDETCGELLGFLDRRDLSENTLVVYVTDNGWIQRTSETEVPDGWRYSFAPRSKQSPYEGGIRTPIMFRWPGQIPAGERDTLVSSIDLAPTILAACGLQAPDAMPGINLLPVCRGESTDRNTLYGEIFAHDVADLDDPAESCVYRWCIQGRYKLIKTDDGVVGRYKSVHPRTHREPQLFDLLQDPHEKHDLADAQPDRLEHLSGVLDTWWNPQP